MLSTTHSKTLVIVLSFLFFYVAAVLVNIQVIYYIYLCIFTDILLNIKPKFTFTYNYYTYIYD